jgi:hypothetical protein
MYLIDVNAGSETKVSKRDVDTNAGNPQRNRKDDESRDQYESHVNLTPEEACPNLDSGYELPLGTRPTLFRSRPFRSSIVESNFQSHPRTPQ